MVNDLDLKTLQEQLDNEIAARRRAETALQRANDELEQRITEGSAALRASEAMFRYFLAQADDGYLIVNDQECIIYANAEARVYLGLDSDREGFPDVPFLTLAQKQYRCEPEVAWKVWPKKTFMQGVVVPLYLVRPETSTARAFWLRATLLDIPAGMDAASGRIIQLKDVTEKTALQEDLSRFHSIIAHKLRTPLVPLYSGLRYMVQNPERLTPEETLSFLREALAGAERLYGEIEDIVRYLNAPAAARPDEGCLVRHLAVLVRQISVDLKLDTVTLSYERDLNDVRLLISEQNMELILWEILENAEKFHPQHHPTVEVKLFRTGKRDIVLQIVDDGLTLSPEQFAQMWIPYHQADKYLTGQIAGMGLGLPFVAMHLWNVGGKCRAFNREDGPGIVVELTLPVVF